MSHTQRVYSMGVPATGGAGALITFPTLPGGVANGLLVTTTLAATVTVTLLDNTTIVLGNHTVGTLIPLRCKAISFTTTGAVVALA